MFSGSMSVCSDEFLATEGLENQKFCEETLDWVLQESGLLRTRDIKHQKQGTTPNLGQNPENYFIEDRIEYFVSIDQKTKGKWHPYISNDL